MPGCARPFGYAARQTHECDAAVLMRRHLAEFLGRCEERAGPTAVSFHQHSPSVSGISHQHSPSGRPVSHAGLGAWHGLGLGLIAAILVYEHAIIGPGDLRRIDRASFDLNGYVSLAYLACVGLDLWLRA